MSSNNIPQYNITTHILNSNTDPFILEDPDIERLDILLPCFISPNGKDVLISPYINVKLKNEEELAELLRWTNLNNIEFVSKSGILPMWYTFVISNLSTMSPIEAAKEIIENELAEAAEPDLISNDIRFCLDPEITKQWNLCNIDDTAEYLSKTDISLPDAWNISTGEDIKVAVIDQPIDITHKDLSSNILDLSYDADSKMSPAVFDHTSPRLYFHGTHVTGIIASLRNNNIDGAGVAPDSKIIPISSSLDSTVLSKLNRAEAIIWASNNGADVISCSWAYYYPVSTINDAINYAYKNGRNGKGCIIVFPAGNDGNNQVDYPSRDNNNVLCVGATDINGKVWQKSNRSDNFRVDVVAPGVEILSTCVRGGMEYKTGTSMAVPHVAGIAALVLAKNPELSSEEVMNLIRYNTKQNYQKSIKQKVVTAESGYGLVDAYQTLRNTPIK